jgi:hypothetical protein
MLPRMFGSMGNPAAANLFNIILSACLEGHEGTRLQVVA